jgi:hypothetical protein
LAGEKFGRGDGHGDKDTALWRRLEALRDSFDDAFFIASEIFDPDDGTDAAP